MIHEFEFFNEAQANNLRERVLAKRGHAFCANGNIETLGQPRYFFGKNFKSDSINEHNQFMQTYFQDTLELCQSFFQNYFQAPIILDKRVSFPGFNIIQCHPNSNFHPHFHTDIFPEIGQVFPDLVSLPGVPTYAFTVLLRSHPEVKAGLAYQQFHNLSLKIQYVFREWTEFNQKMLETSQYQTYVAGRCYVHQGIFHSIVADNTSSTSTFDRVTLQGHLYQTEKGFLLFW